MRTNSFSLADADLQVGQFTHVHEEKEYVLPTGYTLGETVGGEKGIFDKKGMFCSLSAMGRTPVLTSSEGIIYLKAVGTK